MSISNNDRTVTRNFGYVDHVEYPPYYFRQLAPSFLRFAARIGGYHPRQSNVPRYLELGFGRGMATLAHAAADPGEYWGVDMNINHIAYANSLAREVNANVHFVQASFSEFARRTDLPKFDFIVTHGVWSWINDDSRSAIVDIVKRHLAPAGLFYVSHMTLPGGAPYIPLQKIMQVHFDRAASGETPRARLEDAVKWTQKIAERGAGFAQHEGVKKALAGLLKRNPAYVTHDYLNTNFHVASFADIASQLESAGLTFCATADLAMNFDEWSTPDGASSILDPIEDPVLRETAKDYLRDQRFRRDIFIKTPALATPEVAIELLKTRVVTIAPLADVRDEAPLPAGPVSLKVGSAKRIIDALADVSVDGASIEEIAAIANAPARDAVKIIALLCQLGFLSPLRATPPDEVTIRRCAILNRLIIDRCQSDGLEFLVCPAIGAGLIAKLPSILQSYVDGVTAPDELARLFWENEPSSNRNAVSSLVQAVSFCKFAEQLKRLVPLN